MFASSLIKKKKKKKNPKNQIISWKENFRGNERESPYFEHLFARI